MWGSPLVAGRQLRTGEQDRNAEGGARVTRTETGRGQFDWAERPSERELGSGPSDVRVSIVIPTLNEAPNLPHVFAEFPVGLHEVLIVDGRSTDGTIEVARRLRPDARILMQAGRGKGDAAACGFAAATGDVIVMLDADGSANPAEIPRFVDALLAGADFAKGTRFRPGGGSADLTLPRRLGNLALSTLFNVLYGTRYTDLCYGYNAFWRRCLPHMSIGCCGFEVETLISVRVSLAGLKVVEVPSFERRRIHGESKLRAFPDGVRVLRTMVRERLRSHPWVEQPQLESV